MARFIRPANRAYSEFASQIFLPGMRMPPSGSFRTYGTASGLMKSPMDSNLVRILRNKIQNHTEYAPLYQPATELGVFQVTYKPREQLIELTGKYGEDEEIRIQTTTFDCCVIVPGGERRQHLSLHIQITKGDGSKALEVICSSWPDFLEVQRFFVASDRKHQLVKPYIGRYFGALDTKFRRSFYKFLCDRGIDNELSFLLHGYVKNRQKMDSVKWLSKVQSFVEL